jgi:hypothetical protein
MQNLDLKTKQNKIKRHDYIRELVGVWFDGGGG